MTTLLTTFTLTILCLGALGRRTEYDQLVLQINQAAQGWEAGLEDGVDYDEEGLLEARLGASLDFDPDNFLAASNVGENENDTAGETTAQETETTEGDAAATSNSAPRGRRRGNRLLQTPTVASTYPTALDLRTKYPACSSISMIRNQSACGSCWAFASMNSLSDRYCIAKAKQGTHEEKFFAVGDVLSCCSYCNGGSGNGCYGGIPVYAFYFASTTGVTEGETFAGTNGFCKPYFLELTGSRPMQPPSCTSACTNPSTSVAYQSTKFKTSSFTYGKGEAQMIAALNNFGSLSVTFLVYSDFYVYRSGIYSHVSGQMLGGHAVRLIGYGEENGVKFWLLANSWGPGWGEKGFFRMRRGVDECGVESNWFASGII